MRCGIPPRLSSSRLQGWTAEAGKGSIYLSGKTENQAFSRLPRLPSQIPKMLLVLLGVLAVMNTAQSLAPNILVLGGTGFIGSTISRIAIESGCKVSSDKQQIHSGIDHVGSSVGLGRCIQSVSQSAASSPLSFPPSRILPLVLRCSHKRSCVRRSSARMRRGRKEWQSREVVTKIAASPTDGRKADPALACVERATGATKGTAA